MMSDYDDVLLYVSLVRYCLNKLEQMRLGYFFVFIESNI